MPTPEPSPEAKMDEDRKTKGVYMAHARRETPRQKLIREREKFDNKIGGKWLKKHAPKQLSKPIQRQPLERWQIHREKQKQERQMLARPLLTSVE